MSGNVFRFFFFFFFFPLILWPRFSTRDQGHVCGNCTAIWRDPICMDGPDTDIGRGYRGWTWSTHWKIHSPGRSSGLLVPLSWIFHRSIATPPRFIQVFEHRFSFHPDSYEPSLRVHVKRLFTIIFLATNYSTAPTIQIQPHKIYKKQKNNRVIQTSLSRIFFHILRSNIDPLCFPRAKNFSSVRNENRKNREIAGLPSLYRRETFEIKKKKALLSF